MERIVEIAQHYGNKSEERGYSICYMPQTIDLRLCQIFDRLLTL